MQNLYWLIHVIIQKLGSGAITIGGNTLIRKSALLQAGNYNTDIEFWGEDTDTAKRMSKVGRVIYSRHFIMPTSARRFISQGFISLTLTYQYNFFKVIFSELNNK